MPGDVKLTTIELAKEAMKFSAGHFTIFSATERERLHGHNFSVQAHFTGELDDNGMMGVYKLYKRLLLAQCEALDEYLLLPGRSPHLTLRDQGEHVIAEFAGEQLQFPRRDVLVLPIRNITVEELAGLICARLVDEAELPRKAPIHQLTVKVSSGPGQLGTATWRRKP